MTDIAYLGMARLTARLELLSGLHIGAGKDRIEIGGIDSPVVKTPEGDPYVPGSSLKGKLRFLLEWAFGKVNASGEPWGTQKAVFGSDDPLLRIFGTPAKKEAWKGGPTRILLRDATLNENWRQEQLDAGRELTEDKTEVVIDRVAGKALDGVGARHIERVPPGASFAFEAGFRLYDVDGDGGEGDRRALAWLIQALDLLQQDALGGSGSRGYGRVCFRDLTLHGPGGEERKLDNLFTRQLFDRSVPPAAILDAVNEVCVLAPAPGGG